MRAFLLLVVVALIIASAVFNQVALLLAAGVVGLMTLCKWW
jgi:hypothetical protein